MLIGQVILAISFTVNLVFLLILLKRRNEVSNAFSIVISGIVVWIAIVFIWPYFKSLKILYVLGLIAYWGPLAAICGLYYFSFLFPKRLNKSKTLPMVIALCGFFSGVALTLIPGFVLKSVTGNGYQLETGNGLYGLVGIIAVLLFWALFNFIRKYFILKGIYKAQLKFLFFGILITSVIGFISNAAFALLKIYDLIWLGPTITISLVAFTTYSITRYRLMDVRLIVARTIAFGLVVVLLVAVYAILSAIVAMFFENLLGYKSNILVGIIISLLVAGGYQKFLKVIEKTTDKFFFKKTYDPDKLLSEISEISSTILNLQNLSSSIAKILSRDFQSEKIGIALLNSDGKFTISYKQGFKEGAAENLANFPDVASVLDQELKLNPGIQVIYEMKTKYENGDFKPISPILLDALSQENIALIIPLYVKDDLIGIIALGDKKSGDQYTNQDITTLDIVSGQAAIAIENARLYDELKYFNVKLEEEVKQKTSELRSANVQLKRLDQAKSDFISIASHQLRTPLTVIKGYISMMQEGSFGKVPEKINDNLSKVYISNERLINLVEDLLNISRIESGRQQFDWTEFDFVELTGRLTDNLVQNAKNKGLALTFKRPKEKIPNVIAEHNKIQDVMINFIDNAIKYTAKGKIEVTLEAKPKGMLTFCVKDTGRGIDEVTKEALFQKFSRGQGSFQVNAGGTGLGLYVAKMIVAAHEGKIWADSDGVNKGSSFCFSIPISGPKKKTDLPFAQEGQKVENPVGSTAPNVPSSPVVKKSEPGKKKK